MENKETTEERMKVVDEAFGKSDIKMDEVMHVYDTWHENYDKDLKEEYKLDKHIDEFVDFVRVAKDARILDAGAGTGLCGEKLKERGFTNMDALDGSKGMLESAKKKGIYKNFFQALLGPSPIEGINKDTYDAVLCAGALSVHHVRYDSFPSLIEITKPGGYIYFISSVEYLFGEKDKFEEEMRKLQKEGKWRWVLMKESPDKAFQEGQVLIYAFKVL